MLDPGAGSGSLTSALVARVLAEAPAVELEIVAVEIDAQLVPTLEEVLADCAAASEAAGSRLTWTVVNADLLGASAGLGSFDAVILNPPYRKLGAREIGRRPLGPDSPECPNIYASFLAVAIDRLNHGGQVAAITPRSFVNGPYFGSFRRWMLASASLTRLHLFESRSTVFADTNVLQETLIFSAAKGAIPGSVTISTSRDHRDEPDERTVPYAEVVHPDDPHSFIRSNSDDADTDAAEAMASMPATIPDLGVKVSTGKVVDFRSRELLRQPTEVAENDAALLYPGNLVRGEVLWPRVIGKAQALAPGAGADKLLLPVGCYVLIKRFSAKEERRRVVATLLEPADLDGRPPAIENHLNVIHAGGEGMAPDLAKGITNWLNSSLVDRFFRTFSGHTQVNATDLRTLRFPSLDALRLLGELVDPRAGDQAAIDAAVEKVRTMQQSDSP